MKAVSVLAVALLLPLCTLAQSPGSNLTAIENLIGADRFDDALPMARHEVIADSGSAKAHDLLGRVLTRLNRPGEAVSELTTASSLASGDHDICVHLGEAQLSLYWKGIADWRKAHGGSPILGAPTSDVPGARPGGRFPFGPDGDPVRGEPDATPDISRPPKDPRGRRSDGGQTAGRDHVSPVAAMSATEREECAVPARAALASFGRALTLDPGSVDALKGRAYALYALADYTGAADAFEKAAAAAKTDDRLFQMAGDAYARIVKPGDAIRMWEEVIRIEPMRLGAYQKLVSLYGSSGRERWVAKYYLAMERLASGKAAASLDGLKAITEDHPEYAPGWRGLGSAYLALKDGANAVRCLEKSIEADPKDGLSEYQLGAAFILNGESTVAHRHLVKAAQLRPDYAPVWFALGQQAEKQGDAETAIAMYEKAAERRPYWADAHYNLGAVYLDKHELAAALQHLERYLKLKPDAPDSKDVSRVVDQIRAMN